MRRLILSKAERQVYRETGSVEVVRNGFDIIVEQDFQGNEVITIINPYSRVV